MKKILLFFLTIILVFLCCGCSLSANDVNLASKHEILRYAKKNFGAATCVEVDKTQHNKITYILQDKQYGFEYKITSRAQGEGMDGSIFWYKEVKISDYEVQFIKHIMADESIQKAITENPIVIEAGKIYTTDQTIRKKFGDTVRTIGEIMRQYDKNGFFNDYIFVVVDHVSEKYIGTFDYNTQKLALTDIPSIDKYLDRASSYLDCDVEELIFIKHELISKEEITGLSEVKIAPSTRPNQKEVRCYFFRYNDKEYLISEIYAQRPSGAGCPYCYCLTDNTYIFP